MSLRGILINGHKKIIASCQGKDLFWFQSPQLLLLHLALKPLISRYAAGKILDAGAGTSAYKPLFLNYASNYLAVDLGYRQGLDALSDIKELAFKNEAFDTIFCSQVLEHINLPQKAIDEFYRCLKPGGRLILTVPHLACYHELPSDYYRFTAAGISFILTRAGFKITVLKECGGLISFFSHMFSYAFLGIAGHIALLRTAFLFINAALVSAVSLVDSILSRVLNPAPVNIIVIASK